MEIQLPDRPLRTVALLVFIGLVGAGAAGLVMFQDWLDGVRHLAPAEARRALRAAAPIEQLLRWKSWRKCLGRPNTFVRAV